MGKSLTLVSGTEYFAEQLDIKNQKAKVRIFAKGGSADFFIKQDEAQGFATAGVTIPANQANEMDMDSFDSFKVVFTTGTVTIKKIGA